MRYRKIDSILSKWLRDFVGGLPVEEFAEIVSEAEDYRRKLAPRIERAVRTQTGLKGYVMYVIYI